jgi:hypothetical protein
VPEWRSKYLHLMMRRGRKTAREEFEVVIMIAVATEEMHGSD